MDEDEVLLEAESRMDKSIDVLKNEYRGMRTGRANPGLIENVKVEYYGTPTPLKQLAVISAPDPTLLVVKPFDPGSLKDIERGILKSEVGITPNNDGKVIRLAVPPLSEERRRQLVARSKELAEESRVSIRNVRRDANKQADGLQGLSEDVLSKLRDEIDALTRRFTGDVDEILEKKSKELMAF